jgi:hypothetical protein
MAPPSRAPVPAGGPTPEWVSTLAGELRRAGAPLAERGAAEIAVLLGRVAERLLDPADALRAEALALVPPAAGISPEMAVAVLDGMAADWRADRLMRLMEAELGGAAALDGFVAQHGRRAMAIGPALCVQLVAGSVPGVGVSALVRSLLVKGPTLLKPGRGDAVLPVLFARALREVDAALADAVAVVYWPGGSEALEDAALAKADVVTAYGSDRTVRTLRARAPVTARFVAYHHRVSVGVIGRDALTRAAVRVVASDVARAVALFDQRGCVSPQIVYVERGGEVTAEGFADALADALAELERHLPTGGLGVAEASSLQQARGTAELMESTGSVRVRHGGSAAWTVVLGGEGAELTPAGRFVRLRSVADLSELPELLEPLASHLQTVGVAGLGDRVERLAGALGKVGASRVAPFAAIPFPPAWWHHDGRGPLLDLVRWVDVEPA